MTPTTQLLDPALTVAEIVLRNPETARIFQDARIDFCCRGGVSISEACKSAKVAEDALVAKLEGEIRARVGEVVEDDPRSLSTAELVSLLVSRHHAYLRKTLPFMEALAVKVSRVHGDHNPKLRDLEAAFLELSSKLVPHLDDEEQVLFPMLMARATDRAEARGHLASMHAEHLAVGDLLAKIRTASEDFSLPEWACNSYRALFAELGNLEYDTLRHVHLENHVLMPRFA